MANRPSPLFSRIMLLVGAMAIIGVAYFFIETSLAPVPVPPLPVQPGAVHFDPALDVSKDSVFFGLRPLGPDIPTPTTVGRPNPFVPPPVPSTSTLPIPPTTTSSSYTTTTQP